MRKLILFAFLALAALITACSINTANSAGVVNGTPIPYSEFMDSYRSHYENFYTENGRPPDTEERKALVQELRRNQAMGENAAFDAYLRSKAEITERQDI